MRVGVILQEESLAESMLNIKGGITKKETSSEPQCECYCWGGNTNEKTNSV